MAHIFFDFDSTLVSVETLDVLISTKLETTAQKKAIEKITAQGMVGEIPLFESLSKRLSVAKISQQDVQELSQKLPQFITQNLADIIESLQQNGHKIHILSGGFKDYMHHTATALNIPKNNIHANEFTYGEDGFINGLNQQNPLCQNGGKGQVISHLNLKEKVILIGDGYTDLEVYLEGKCRHFIGFGIHESRDIIKEKAPFFIKNIDELNSILDELLTNEK